MASDQLQVPDLTGVVEEEDEAVAGQEGTARRGGGLLARLTAPLGKVLAPLGGPLLRARALAAPLGAVTERVPLPILTGVGSGVAIVLLVLIVATIAVGGGGSAAAVESAASRVAASDDHSAPAPAIPTRAPATPTPSGPTPTPTPLRWTAQSGGWLALGAPLAAPPFRLAPSNLLLFEDVRGLRTITAKFSVLSRSGGSSPMFGILLTYKGELDHMRVHFFSDDYDQARPYVGLWVTKDGKDTRVGNTKRILDYDFWGRNTHEAKVAVAENEVRVWVDGRSVMRWPNPGVPADGIPGLYVLGQSRMQFDPLVVE